MPEPALATEICTFDTPHRTSAAPPGEAEDLDSYDRPPSIREELSPGVVAAQGLGTSMTSPLGMVWGDDAVRRGSSRFTAWSGVESQNTMPGRGVTSCQ
jgi:hypothetical protein